MPVPPKPKREQGPRCTPATLPPIWELKASDNCRPILEGIRRGEEIWNINLKHNIVTEQLGEIGVPELVALYAPWELTEVYLGVMEDRYCNFEELFGDNWQGFRGPTALLSLFNPYPETTARVFLNHPLLTEELLGEYPAGIDPQFHTPFSVDLTRAWFGKRGPIKAQQTHVVRKTAAVIQYLSAQMEQPNDEYGRSLAAWLDIDGSATTWEPTLVHTHPDLLPFYRQISSCVTEAMKTGWPEEKHQPLVNQVNLWLKDLAQAFIRQKIEDAKDLTR